MGAPETARERARIEWLRPGVDHGLLLGLVMAVLHPRIVLRRPRLVQEIHDPVPLETACEHLRPVRRSVVRHQLLMA